MTDSPRLAAIAVVIRDDKVLLVKRRNEPDAGLWGFPGGHVNLGETAKEAAVRELCEETGIAAKSLTYLTNVDVIVRDKNCDVRHHFLLAVVLCEYLSGEPIAADDVNAAEWRPITDLLSGRILCSEHVDTVVKIAVRKSRSLAL
ncbi:NUDIX hydrolase [Ruegeria sp. EL01]|jgi:mutator protein MutT|uniref:NUDIX hydrolase n=1 Tax=Ruegeria sp. EL01 TaxID=2107578 RepID=UPI000EA82B54|nr:NUDIX hydrolase [Ruegeria sp. EL01]